MEQSMKTVEGRSVGNANERTRASAKRIKESLFRGRTVQGRMISPLPVDMWHIASNFLIWDNVPVFVSHLHS